MIMEYKKKTHFLNNAPNRPPKFRTRNQVWINYESLEKHKKHIETRFRSSMLRSNLCGYIDAYMLVSETVTITGAGAENDTKKRDQG